jgi:hypothetical protein
MLIKRLVFISEIVIFLGISTMLMSAHVIYRQFSHDSKIYGCYRNQMIM